MNVYTLRDLTVLWIKFLMSALVLFIIFIITQYNKVTEVPWTHNHLEFTMASLCSPVPMLWFFPNPPPSGLILAPSSGRDGGSNIGLSEEAKGSVERLQYLQRVCAWACRLDTLPPSVTHRSLSRWCWWMSSTRVSWIGQFSPLRTVLSLHQLDWVHVFKLCFGGVDWRLEGLEGWKI